MIFDTRPVGPFEVNVYVVGCPTTRQAAIIDAGGDVEWVAGVLEAHGLELSHILQTHAHIDHVAGLAQSRARWPQATVAMHRGELPVLQAAPMLGAMFGMPIEPPDEPDQWLEDGAVVAIGSLRFEVLHTPGHTPGHVVFYERGEAALFSGDLLFAGSIGRTDLPGGDYPTIVKSLALVAALPEDVKVYSGHGPATTIGRERRHNPFL